MGKTEEHLRELASYMRSEIEADTLDEADVVMFYRELSKHEYKVDDFPLSVGDELMDIDQRVQEERPDLIREDDTVEELLTQG